MPAVAKGQEYEAVQPVRSEPKPRHARIRVVGRPRTIPGIYGFGKVDVVTLTADGRELRRRAIEMCQLHAAGLTAAGQPRKTGYRLVKDTDGGEA